MTTDLRAQQIVAAVEAQLRPRICALQARNVELEDEIKRFKELYSQIVLEKARASVKQQEIAE